LAMGLRYSGPVETPRSPPPELAGGADGAQHVGDGPADGDACPLSRRVSASVSKNLR
jgi:hypothetical protein